MSSLLISPSSVMADEEDQPILETAPTSYLLSLLDMCTSYIEGDEELNGKLTQPLLACINQELREGYYFPISTLPVDNDIESEDESFDTAESEALKMSDEISDPNVT